MQRSAPQYGALGLWTTDSIGRLLTPAAHRWPDRELIYINERRYSYGEIERWVTAAAHDLYASGVRPDDRVVLQLGNCIELLVLQLAAWRIGAVTVPVVPIYRGHELRHILSQTQPRALVTMSRFGDRSPLNEFTEMLAAGISAPKLKMLVDAEDPSRGWRRTLPIPDPAMPISEDGLPEPASPDAVCLILYTSGTTSAPKGAMLSGRALLSNADNWRLTLLLSPSDVACSGAPLAHIAAMCSAFLAPARSGGRSVILSGWKPDLASQVIAQEGATYMAGASVFLQDLVERYEAGAARLRTGLMFCSGGAATTPRLIERADKVGITAFRCYGMTETAGTCTLASRDAPLERRANYDGRVEFGTELLIVDDDGRPLAPGQVGHVLVRSPQMMLGYTDPVISAAQLDPQGWFRTGDLGSVDAEGWFMMAGRVKDIINRGGEKFSTADIEMALASHPDVDGAAVVGAPHARLGECVAAFIVLRPGAEWRGPDALLAHLERQRLARSKFPTEWTILDQLPMTATGKIQKQKLLDLLVVRKES